MPDRAALYLRVSSDEQRKENLSIANQLAQCLEYVQKRGYVLADVGRYVDASGNNAASGTPAFAEDASARVVTTPVLLELLAAARAGAFDVMVALDVTRVSRGEPFLLGALRKQLKDYGVRLEYARMTTGDKRTDTVMESMHALASFFESGDKAYRTRNGKRQSAEVRHRHTGPAPFGYTTDADKRLAPDPQSAPIARTIFESYLKGSSLRKIARELTAAQVPPAWAAKRGNTVWASQTIGKILKNPVYRGTYVFGVHERIEGKLVRAEPGKQVEIPCPALVTDDEWYKVQDRLAQSAAMVRNHPTSRIYPLRGHIFCTDCGRAYVGQWNARSNRTEYRHRTRDGGCRHHAVSGEIEKDVYWTIIQFVLDPVKARRQYNRAFADHLRQFGHIDDMLASAKAERAKQDRALDKLTAAYLDPDMQMTKSKYLGLRDGIAKKVDALERQMVELNTERGKSPLPPMLEDFETFYAYVRSTFGGRLSKLEEATLKKVREGEHTPEEDHQFFDQLRQEARTPKRMAEMIDALNVRVEVGPDRSPKVTIIGQSTRSS